MPNFRNSIKEAGRKLLKLQAPLRRRKLNNTDFTIISNNCWGGICYEYFGLEKLSPTVGMYFFAEDYVRFVSDFKRYNEMPIEIITADESKHKDSLYKSGHECIPIGRLDDVEIVFLHYKDSAVAKAKWERRVKRINWDNLIFKFSYMNGCTDKMVHQFEKAVNGFKSVVLATKKFPEYDNVYIVQGQGDQVTNDTKDWNKYFDVVGFLNR